MQRLFRVFAYELRRNVQRRGYLFMTFGVPVLIIVAMLIYQVYADLRPEDADQQQQEEENSFGNLDAAGYVDQSGLIQEPQGALARFLTPYENVEAAREALQTGEIDVYYVIPEDYLETGKVDIHVPRFSVGAITTAPISQLVYNTLGADLPPQVVQRLRNTVNLQQFDLTRTGGEAAPEATTAEETTAEAESAESPAQGSPQAIQENFDTDFLMVYVFSIIFMLGLFLTNGYLLQTVIEEKENKLIEILIASVRPAELLTGKILAMGLLGLLQILVWLVGIAIILTVFVELPAFAESVLPRIQIPWGQMPIIVAFFIAGYFVFAAGYGAVGALSNSMSEGPQYAVVFTLPAVFPLYFLGVIIETPNATLPVILSLFPITAPLGMTSRILMTNVPLGEILLSLGLLVLTALAMMWLAGRLFRVQTLLSGQVPKLREIPRLLRG